MSIHDELERIAARAPEVVVPADTWGRAQRARRRQRYGVVAMVAVVVLLAGGLVWWPTIDDVDPADTDTVGVPHRLWSVPERMSARDGEGAWLRDEVTQDVTSVGLGAATWVTDEGLPVVVDADAGDYHLLDLPDFAGNNELFTHGLGQPTTALSPDGRLLAYGYAVFGPEAAVTPIPSGVRVVDLRTGALREIPVPGEEGTAVGRIVWSPDGRWLAFSGLRMDSWTEFSMGASRPVLGRIAPASDQAEVISADEGGGLAVDDRGTVLFDFAAGRRWAGGPSAEHAGRGAREVRLVLGRTEDGAPVRLTGPFRSDSEAVELRRGAVTILLGPGIGGTLSLATGLMTRERPTVVRPEPDWPTDWEAVATKVAWVAVPGAFLLILLLPWLRRRLSAGRPTTGPAAH